MNGRFVQIVRHHDLALVFQDQPSAQQYRALLNHTVLLRYDLSSASQMHPPMRVEGPRVVLGEPGFTQEKEEGETLRPAGEKGLSS